MIRFGRIEYRKIKTLSNELNLKKLAQLKRFISLENDFSLKSHIEKYHKIYF